MFKEKIKGFIAGVCATALIAGVVTVFAGDMNIQVYKGGIKVYWDGIEKTLTDANGNPVEPMIHLGTTYVPLRAMGNLMGKEVDWDGQNMAVYVGQKPVAQSTSIADMADKVNKKVDMVLWTGKDATFPLKDKKVQCDTVLRPTSSYGGEILYVLDGKYTELQGKAVFPYEEVGASGEGRVTFYSVANDGEESELITYNVKQTEEPVNVKVNLRGVANLKIKIQGSKGDNKMVLYDAYFLG